MSTWTKYKISLVAGLPLCKLPIPITEMPEMIILHSCAAHCACTWRRLFHEKGIFPVEQRARGAKAISLAIEQWIHDQPAGEEKWQNWSKEDAALLMSTVEKVR